MENSILQDEDGFRIMKQQIELTMSNFISKRDLLKSQVELYNDLRDAIKTSAEKVMVFLGDGYFVEMNKPDARDFLARRLNNLKEATREFDSKINQAEDTLDQLVKLENMGNDGEKEKLNEEGIPFMDIQEEIDEDGNVLSVKVNNKDFSTENNNSEVLIQNSENGVKINEIVNRETDSNDLNLSFVGEHDSTNHSDFKEIELDNAAITRTEIEPVIEDGDSKEQLQEMFEDMEIIEKDDVDQRFSNNHLDQDTLLNKIDELKISNEDKFRLKELCIQQFKEAKEIEEKSNDLQAESIEKKSDDVVRDIVEAELFQNSSNQVKPDIDNILELQILADDFNDSGEYNQYADDEEWDFDFDEDDDNADYSDELLYEGKYTPFISQGKESTGVSANDLLWSQIMENRRKKDEERIDRLDVSGEEDVHRTKSILKVKNPIKNAKKSVSFSNELEINEIENVSEQLKSIVHKNQNFSKFKQQKIQTYGIPVNNDHNIKSNENPLSDFIVEKNSSIYDKTTKSADNDNPLSEFVVEKDNFVDETINVVADKPLSDLIVEKESTPLIDKIVECEVLADRLHISDGSTKNGKFETSTLPNASNAKISQFRKMKAQNPVISKKLSTIPLNLKAKKFEVNDFSIIPFEKDTTIDRVSLLKKSISDNENKAEEETKTKRVSKFKASRTNSGTVHERNYNNQLTNTSNAELGQNSVEENNLTAAPTNGMSEIEPVGEIIESSGNMSQESEFKQQNISKFKAARSSGSGHNGQTRADEIAPSASSETRNDTVTPEFAEASLDYSTLQEDLDTMAKAYIMGMYDDDIDTEGPVVDKVEDFEVLNEMINSMPSSAAPANDPRIQEVVNQPYDPAIDEILPPDDFDDDEGPILMDEIVENDFDYADVETPSDSEQLDLQDDFLNHEVVTNYQKLRQKIIFQNNESGFKKSSEEREIEPLDEDGNPVQVSRFRAARPNFK